MLTDNPDIFSALTNILRNSLGWNGLCINILYLMIYQSVRFIYEIKLNLIFVVKIY